MSDSTESQKRPPLKEGGLLHASCVAYQGKAVLITGRSGSGKSSLALDLISRGADLVADDQVILSTAATPQGRALFASCPQALVGKIEVRGVGILNATPAGAAQVALAVDLDQTEVERLPQWHTIARLGVTLPLLFSVPHPHFAPAILQYLSHGRYA